MAGSNSYEKRGEEANYFLKDKIQAAHFNSFGRFSGTCIAVDLEFGRGFSNWRRLDTKINGDSQLPFDGGLCGRDIFVAGQAGAILRSDPLPIEIPKRADLLFALCFGPAPCAEGPLNANTIEE